jgi:hypothetical protein
MAGMDRDHKAQTDEKYTFVLNAYVLEAHLSNPSLYLTLKVKTNAIGWFPLPRITIRVTLI